jgi:anaerobic magnesium-protoporphyrin IX monomethyl ester cyclase
MKRVALINPGTGMAYQEPLNLGFLASYLELHNVQVTIIDEQAGQNVFNEIDKYNPDIVAITATTPTASSAYKIADRCKQQGILTVMGGVHASILPDEALKHVDIVIVGEGEKALLDIVLDNNINSRIISRPYIKNIDDVPIPSRHLMQMEFYLRTKDRIPDSYLYFVPPNTRTASIITSRGCPYNCVFCHNTWKHMPCRYNTPERVISEIKELVEQYDVHAIFFIEDNLFVNRKRLISICELLKKENLDLIWGGNARVDNIDEEILQIAKDAGCRQVTFGFESGSQKTLDRMKKGTTVEQNKEAIDACNEIGIIPQGTFMIGNPHETHEDTDLTIEFIINNKIESAGVCITVAYPGTDLWSWCFLQGKIPHDLKWDDFTFGENPIKICDDILYDELKQIQFRIDQICYFRKNNNLKMSKLALSSIKYPDRFFTMLNTLIHNPQMIIPIIKRMKIQ